MLDDAEWSQMSDREIAEHCGVPHPFVAAIRNPQMVERQQDARTKSPGKKVAAVESDSKPAQAPAAAPAAAAPPAFQTQDEHGPGDSRRRRHHGPPR